MSECFDLKIAKPDDVIFREAVLQVVIPGSNGYFTVLSGHEPVVGMLRPGVLELITASDKELHFFVRGGFVEVSLDGVILLVSNAICADKLTNAEVESELILAKRGLQTAVSDVDKALATQVVFDVEAAFARCSAKC